MNSVVNLCAFANASNVPIVVFVDMQQEFVAVPRLLPISGVDRLLGNCRKAVDSSSPSALIDATHRNHKVTYPCDAGAGHELEPTDAWINSTILPRKLGIGNNAGE